MKNIRERFSDRKIVLGILSFILCLGIVIVSSFFPFIIDPTHLDITTFLTNELIIFAITIASLVSIMLVAQSLNAKDIGSKVYKAEQEFIKSRFSIDSDTLFFKWVKKELQPRDKRNIIIRKLELLAIPKESAFDYYDLTISEIENLVNLKTYTTEKGVVIRGLNAEQVKGIIKLKKQMPKLKFVEPSYYTTTQSFNATKTLSEIATKENQHKAGVLTTEIIGKLLITFITAFIFGSLVYDIGNEPKVSQALITFFSRLWAMCSAGFLGYRTGIKINNIDAFYVNKRIEVHKLYREDIKFHKEELEKPHPPIAEKKEIKEIPQIEPPKQETKKIELTETQKKDLELLKEIEKAKQDLK